MASFSLLPINDNPDGGWGPSTSNLPDQFKFRDIPYAPYSKSDKLGRFADWNDPGGDGRGTGQPTFGGLPNAQNTRGGGPGRSNRRDGTQAFGSGTASAFAYFHVEDESSFSLVDNKPAPRGRGGAFTRGGRGRGAPGFYAARGNQRGGRGGFTPGRGGNRGARRGWRDWDKVALLYHEMFFSSYVLSVHLEQPYSRILSRHFSSMDDAGGDRIPPPFQAQARGRRARGSVSNLLFPRSPPFLLDLAQL
jgi:hypothetical protein